MNDASHNPSPSHGDSPSLLDRLIRFCLENKLFVNLLVLAFVAWGVIVAPFDWNLPFLHRDPVPVDAIPDIGENQQIVFTEWMGRSPRDMEDQVTYPLTVSLLGIPGVKTVRSYSMFGFSQIFVIFQEKVDFYWSRSRVLEKLNSLPEGYLPDGVKPTLGPDATPLGQVFWYTLEGRDPQGQPTGGWRPDELRSIQDWTVRFALQSAEGVSEVASVGGYVKEYQVDVDPDAMRAHGVTLGEVADAVRKSNLDVGASLIEINQAEYLIRSIGFVKQVEDLENTVVKVTDNVPIYVRNVAHVSLGPELRRGALDKSGAEAVGGVVVVRYGENPLAAIKNVKFRIDEISAGLPKKTLPDGTESQVRIVPYYDRTELIYETLGTLNTAIYEEVLVTTIVILLMVGHFASSVLISAVMPLAVLGSFIAMKVFGVDANIVSLSGIAIAIGTVVDMGIIVCENILKHLDAAAPGEDRLEVVYRAASEVGSAVLTAISTTVVSFLPVFAMEGAEGKLFKPLAFTKTFALIASVIVALTIIPAFAHTLFGRRIAREGLRRVYYGAMIAAGLAAAFVLRWWIGAIVIALGAYHLARPALPERFSRRLTQATSGLTVLLVLLLLTTHWMPIGPDRGLVRNFVIVLFPIGGLMLFFLWFQRRYERLLRWCLVHKAAFLAVPALIVFFGLMVWLGFDRMFGWLPRGVRTFAPVSYVAHKFPGLGKEFMPPLDEGSYLFMPTTMPHAGIGEVLDILGKQDVSIDAIPEVESVVGKLGRVESALDPAPVPMIETVVLYKPRYLVDRDGRRLTFEFNPRENDLFRDADGNPLPAPDGEPYKVRGRFERDENGRLVPSGRGKPFLLWRPALDPELNTGRAAWSGIQKPDDIWDQIVEAARIPGTTSAPRLQPIATRIVMLQSGMRAAMGVKVKGPTLEAVEAGGLQVERFLKEVPYVEPATVIADRIIGKPYLEIVPDRTALARYGVMLEDFQDIVEVAIGGKRLTTTVEGRERYPVRVRYLRELRDSIEALDRILVPAAGGAQIPVAQLAEIRYARGPEMIKSEDTFLTGYVLFDKKAGVAEVDVVEQAAAYLEAKRTSGELQLPEGVTYAFAGSYENQIRAAKKLAVIIPLALFVIYLILYVQFKRYVTSLFVFSGIVVAWCGGFLLIWLYGQSWFLDFALFGVNLRDLFQVHPINMSVAIWVGFLALFGIASDDGVVICTYLDQRFAGRRFASVAEIREATVEAGLKRIRPCLMTTATTVLALLPVLTSSGRGADIMVPMAIPSFGGMIIEVITMLVAPVLYCAVKEWTLRHSAGPATGP
ncbi:MAG: efflux RND transporter permease subunit [Kiritimatiellae bacterium]|nr:efflux RND transporter permease subunit [Kiritimatiellia bacterium]